MSGRGGVPVSEAFVEALGLKALFIVFMGKVGIQMFTFHHSNQQQKSTKRQKTNVDLPHSEDIGHILGIVSSLLTNLASDSTHRIRLLTKFVEGNYEKVDKLLEIREGARKRLRNIEEELELEKQVRLVIP